MPILSTMAANIDSILKLEVPVIVQIAQRTMPVEEVVAMAPGAIIELPKSSADDLEILVNNKPVGTGSAVKVGENFGVRVSYIGDLAQRIAAMGEIESRAVDSGAVEDERAVEQESEAEQLSD